MVVVGDPIMKFISLGIIVLALYSFIILLEKTIKPLENKETYVFL